MAFCPFYFTKSCNYLLFLMAFCPKMENYWFSKKGNFLNFFFLTTGVSTFSIKLKADKAIMVKGGETGLERRDLGEKRR